MKIAYHSNTKLNWILKIKIAIVIKFSLNYLLILKEPNFCKNRNGNKSDLYNTKFRV